MDFLTYELWILYVAEIVYSEIGMELGVPDENYRIHYEHGFTPEQMVSMTTYPIYYIIEETIKKHLF